ncbi:MAG TPA: phosphatase PAP2 family protein [Jatrophihabitans sp.]|jgi:hypothetical protein|nr:phosphatase PAP2 family protein [Jatrophihabitans sp.]
MASAVRPTRVATNALLFRGARRFSARAARVLMRRYMWWVEVGAVLAFYFAYEATRALAPATPAQARSNADEVLSVEHVVHLSPERGLNRALATLSWLSTAAGYYYLTLHFAVTVVVLALLYLGRPQMYARARSSLVVASFAALLAFWFVPVAPPRLAEHGIVDVVVRQNVYGMARAQRGHSPLENVYAAMPSLHVGWALWVALVAQRAFRGPWRHLGWAYPAVTTLVVFSTGNHYLLDALAGAALVLGADVLVGCLARELYMPCLPALKNPERDDGYEPVNGSYRVALSDEPA